MKRNYQSSALPVLFVLALFVLSLAIGITGPAQAADGEAFYVPCYYVE